jgi:diphthamide biosynthesis enzyme Dph1/Dph2-like protein
MNSSEENLCQVYELNECVKWIEENNFNSIALQFSRNSLENSSTIALILKRRTKSQFYISVSTMCCVDYLTIKHLNDSTIDAIIYFGSVCLTSDQSIDSLPVLYVFGNNCKHFIDQYFLIITNLFISILRR